MIILRLTYTGEETEPFRVVTGTKNFIVTPGETLAVEVEAARLLEHLLPRLAHDFEVVDVALVDAQAAKESGAPDWPAPGEWVPVDEPPEVSEVAVEESLDVEVEETASDVEPADDETDEPEAEEAQPNEVAADDESELGEGAADDDDTGD